MKAEMLTVFSAAYEKRKHVCLDAADSHPRTIREAPHMMTSYIKKDSRDTKRNRVLWDFIELQDQALFKATLEFPGT